MGSGISFPLVLRRLGALIGSVRSPSPTVGTPTANRTMVTMVHNDGQWWTIRARAPDPCFGFELRQVPGCGITVLNCSPTRFSGLLHPFLFSRFLLRFFTQLVRNLVKYSYHVEVEKG